jgi:hypothetical protein
MGFRSAVAGTAALKDAYRDGLQALKNADRARICCSTPRNLTGSIDLERALATSHPNDPRWDYGIGIRKGEHGEIVTWVEVHPATSHGVGEVCRKRLWLTQWLESSAPLLNRMAARYVWIASGNVALPPNSPQRKRIAANGIQFAGRILHL